MVSKKAKKIIRERRAVECFSICDRAAWYDALPTARKEEVQEWRKKWLMATETGVIPNKPAWIK